MRWSRCCYGRQLSLHDGQASAAWTPAAPGFSRPETAGAVHGRASEGITGRTAFILPQARLTIRGVARTGCGG